MQMASIVSSPSFVNICNLDIWFWYLVKNALISYQNLTVPICTTMDTYTYAHTHARIHTRMQAYVRASTHTHIHRAATTQEPLSGILPSAAVETGTQEKEQRLAMLFPTQVHLAYCYHLGNITLLNIHTVARIRTWNP